MLYRSSKVLLDSLDKLQLEGKSVLEMGTGSGLIAIAAAKMGASVQGLDINPVAIACSRSNALLNGVGDRTVFSKSDLFSACETGIKYDYIIWNPPFYTGSPTDIASSAWFGGEELSTIGRFVQESPTYLAPGGQLILLLSSDMNQKFVLETLGRAGYAGSPIHAQRFMFETVTVYAFSLSS